MQNLNGDDSFIVDAKSSIN